MSAPTARGRPPPAATGTLGFVNGPGTPPTGSGSLSIAVGLAAQHRQFYGYGYGICATGPVCSQTGTDLSSISGLGYATYRAGSTQPNVVPTFNIEIDPDSTTGSGVDYVVARLGADRERRHGRRQHLADVGPVRLGEWPVVLQRQPERVRACCVRTVLVHRDLERHRRRVPQWHREVRTGCECRIRVEQLHRNVDRLVVGVDGDDTVYDFEQEPRLSVGDASIHEGDTGKRFMRFMVNLDRIAPGAGVAVKWVASPGSGDGQRLQGRHRAPLLEVEADDSVRAGQREAGALVEGQRAAHERVDRSRRGSGAPQRGPARQGPRAPSPRSACRESEAGTRRRIPWSPQHRRRRRSRRSTASGTPTQYRCPAPPSLRPPTGFTSLAGSDPPDHAIARSPAR